MPTGMAMSGMMLPLSETAAFLWKLLQEAGELARAEAKGRKDDTIK